MKTFVAGLAGLMLCAGSLAAQEFQLGFDFPDELGDPPMVTGEPGSTVDIPVDLTLSSTGIEGPDGAQGWSFGVRNTGIDIVDVTTAGTVAADVSAGGLRNGGFEVTQMIDPAKNDGAQGLVSAIVLSFTQNITLPPNETNVVGKATYRATVGDAESTATLEYLSGLVGAGQPVDNNVTLAGASIAPVAGSADIVIKPLGPGAETDCGDGVDNDEDGATDCADDDCADVAPCGEESTAAGNCDDGIDNDNDGATDAEDPDCMVAPEEESIAAGNCDDGIDNDQDGLTDAADPDCQAPGGDGFSLVLGADGAENGTLEVARDSTFQVCAFIQPSDAENPPADGVQGWSLGVEFDGSVLNAVSATTSGTLGADVSEGGLRSNGFEKTEVVDPARNDGQNGVVSAVVLSFTEAITLDPTMNNKVLAMTFEVADDAPADFETTLQFVDGLRGAGQPVDTVLTVQGGTVIPDVLGALRVVEGEAPVEAQFIRGDANDDGKVNIADPIWIINELFRQGPATTCQDAADATDDGTVDLADAMYIIEYRFLAGPVPPDPFPGCGTDPTADDLDCAAGSHTSCP